MAAGKKVVYVTAESYLDHSFTIARELQKHIELRVIMQAREKTPELERWCETIGAEFLQRRRFRNPFAAFGELKFIRRLRKMDADCIWFDTLSVHQVIWANLLLKNYYVMVHDVDKHPDDPQYHASLALKMTFALMKKRICVASKTQAELFKKRFGFEAKKFQLPVIDYYKNSGSNAILPDKVNSKIRFFFFGTVEAYKGVETLLDAADILEKKGLSFQLNIYGRLKYDQNKLKKRAGNQQSTSLFDDFVDYTQVHNIYAANNILVLPYKQVTQCGPLLIGYSENIPSICSDQPGFREYVEDGKGGFIYGKSADELASKMEDIIKNPGQLERMKEYIASEVQKKFSMEALAEEYLRNFEVDSNA